MSEELTTLAKEGERLRKLVRGWLNRDSFFLEKADTP